MGKLSFWISLVILAFSLPVSGQDIKIAIAHFENKKYEDARKILEMVKKDNHHYAESRYYLGLIMSKKEDFPKSEEYLKQAISTKENVAKYHLAIGNVYLQLARNAHAIRQAGYASKIRSHLETAVKLEPHNMNSSILLVGLYMRAPKILGGDPAKAKELAGNMQRINRAEGHRAYGMISQAEEKYPEAENHYRQALGLAPDSLKHYQSLVSFFQSRKNYNEAFKIQEKAIEKFPKNSSLLLQAGRLASQPGTLHSDKGSKYLGQYIETKREQKDRNMANAYYYLGLIEKNKMNVPQAKAHFNKALAIQPAHSQAEKSLKELN